MSTSSMRYLKKKEIKMELLTWLVSIGLVVGVGVWILRKLQGK